MRFNDFGKRARDRARADESSPGANSLVPDEPSLLMALKHGVCSSDPVIEGLESNDDWIAHRDRVIREIDPVGALESAYAQRAASYLWRIDRVARYRKAEARTDSEAATIERDRRTPTDPSMIETVAKYEVHLNRMLAQTMAELRRMQKEREKRSRKIDAESETVGRPSVAFQSIPIERFLKHAVSAADSPNAINVPTADPQTSPAPSPSSNPAADPQTSLAPSPSSNPTDPDQRRSKE